jgi:hypothetical protein
VSAPELPPIAAGPVVETEEDSASATLHRSGTELKVAVRALVAAAPVFVLACLILASFGLLASREIDHAAWLAVTIGLVVAGFLLTAWGAAKRVSTGSLAQSRPDRVAAGPQILASVFTTYAFLGWTARSFPLGLQIAALSLSALFLVVSAAVLSTSSSRSIAFGLWSWQLGRHAPPAQLALFLTWQTTLFAALTLVLQQHGVVTLAAKTTPPNFDGIAQFYSWQAVDLLPLLDVTKTLHWSAPLSYHDTNTGLAVLVFKALIVGPVIGTFLQYWRSGRSES